MKFPNWFRIAWWVALLLGLSYMLSFRLGAIASGQAVPADVFIFLIWVALLLVPLFGELSFFGITLKQQVKELADQVAGLQNEIRNTVDVRTQINPVFQMPAPPPDSQLPLIEQRLRTVLQDVLRTHGIDQAQVKPAILDVPEDVAYLFKARYEIERELRRIWRHQIQGDEGRRPLPTFHIVRTLASEGLLDPRLANIVREVYSVASPAIHGEPVTEAKLAFVRDVAPELIAALKAID